MRNVDHPICYRPTATCPGFFIHLFENGEILINEHNKPMSIVEVLEFAGSYPTAFHIPQAALQMNRFRSHVAAIWEYENLRTRALNGDWRAQLNKMWRELREGEKMFYGIFFLNTLVFGAWRIPQLKSTMVKYFCSNPFTRNVCWPMVLSTFSHYSLFHFGANMYVLHSFSTISAQMMGKEQFLAFYLSAGVVSSLASHVAKAMMMQPGLSLGASGAIFGILAYFCSRSPESKLGIAFVPNFSFSADTGLKCLMAFDTVGLLLRWKMFDHAAHLGGALFGLAWFHWGQYAIWGRRDEVMNVWHQFRTRME
nr:EOG090X07NR [Sida crystallina]